MSMPPQFQIHATGRAALCLLGNAAAPLQVLWTFASLLAGAGQHIDKLAFIHPLEVTEKYGNFVKDSYRLLIPSPMSCPPTRLDIKAEDGSTLSIFAATATTIGNFLQAERITLDWGYTQIVRAGDFLLSSQDDLHHLASQADLQLERQPKRRRTASPQGLLMIGLQCGSSTDAQFFISCVPAGTFLFECMREHGFNYERFVVDDDGRLFGGDTRLWTSGRFTILEENSFPSILMDPAGMQSSHDVPGHSGPGGATCGLGSHIIDQVLHDWIQQCYGSSPQPWCLKALWMDSDFQVTGLPQQVEDNVGEVLAPLAHRHHWALLYGRQSLRMGMVLSGWHRGLHDGGYDPSCSEIGFSPADGVFRPQTSSVDPSG